MTKKKSTKPKSKVFLWLQSINWRARGRYRNSRRSIHCLSGTDASDMNQVSAWILPLQQWRLPDWIDESQISSRLLPGNLVFRLIFAILNPDLNCLILIECTRSNHVFRGVACHGYNTISMTFEFLHYFSCLEIPQVDDIVFWTTDNVLAICDWKCRWNAELWVNVSSICLQELTCGEVPESLHWRLIQKGLGMISVLLWKK